MKTESKPKELKDSYFIAAVLEDDFHLYLHCPDGKPRFSKIDTFLDARFVQLDLTCDLITEALKQAGLAVAPYQEKDTREFPELAKLFCGDEELDDDALEQVILSQVFLS